MTLSKKEWKSIISFLIIAGVLTAISCIEYFDKVFYVTGRISFILSLTLIIKTLTLEKLEG